MRAAAAAGAAAASEPSTRALATRIALTPKSLDMLDLQTAR
jgi:hypothetical protein